MAAPTPTGAKYMTMFVNLNMVSDRPWATASTGRRFFSSRRASEIPKRTLKTTTWRTCPSATDFATFSGKTWRITSAAVCFCPLTSESASSAGG